MKKTKIFLLLLSLTFAASKINVKAIDGFMGYSGVTLNSSKNDYITRGPVAKTQESAQHYHNTGTVGNYSGNQIKMRARVKDADNGGTSSWVTFSQGQTKSFGSNNFTIYMGNYKIHLSRNSSSLVGEKATHSGLWYLNENLM